MLTVMNQPISIHFNYEQFNQKFYLHQQAFLSLMLNFVDHFNKINNFDDRRIELTTYLINLDENLDESDLDFYQNKYFIIDDNISYDDLYYQLKNIESEYKDEIQDLLHQKRELLKDIFKQSQIQKSKSWGK